MKTRSFAAALLAATFFLGGCGEKEADPLDVQEVALHAETNLRQVAGELVRALAFLKESQLLGGWVNGFCDQPLPGSHHDDRTGDRGEDDFLDDDFFDDDCSPFDIEARTTAWADILSQRIFTQANVESNRGGVLVFHLRPEVTCGSDDGCYETLTRFDLRLQVTSDAPGDLDIAVLVGPSRFQPLVLGLHREDLTAEVDLGELKRTVEYLTRGSAPMAMAGKVQLGVARHGEGRFTASVSILEAISIRALNGDDFHLELAPAFPALSLQLDENDHGVRLVAGLGRMNLLAPFSAFRDDDCSGFGSIPPSSFDDSGDDDWDDCSDEGTDGTLGLRAGGLTGTLSFSSRGGVDELHVDGLGLGPDAAVVEVDGAQVVRIDLNEDLGRKVDVVARAERSGVTLQFSPGLDLKLALNFIHVARIFDVPSWMLEESLRIRLDGAASPMIRLFAEDGFDDDDDWGRIESESAVASLQVLAGRLLLESTQAGSLEVGEGMCLFDTAGGFTDDDEPTSTHPFDHLLVEECG